MNELSEAMGITGSTMTRIVDPLVHKKLVQRKPDEEDRRIVRVSLTESGRELRSTLEKELQEFFNCVMGEFQTDEIPHVIDSISKLNRAFIEAFKKFS